jgi:hypothetical protein
MVGIGPFYSMRGKATDLTGQRFGRLVVIGQSKTRAYGRVLAWDCRCDCGTVKPLITSVLNSGSTKSCGCLKRECKPPILRKHGLSYYSGMKVWQGMIRRCTNPEAKDFAQYGGRGIKVCERWLDVRNFAEDMGEKPDGHSLDRINTHGDYCPENCRWATPAEQGANKRNNRMIEHEGQVLHMSEWCRRLGVKPSTVINRLNSGMDPSLALTMPLQRKRRAA